MKFKKAAISSGKSKTGERVSVKAVENTVTPEECCLLYTSDAADELT